MPRADAPSLRARLGTAIGLGVAAAIYVVIFYGHQSPLAVSDFDAIWVGARALRGGGDPYAAIQSPPWPWDLQYPLPAILVATPFSFLPLPLARAAFMGVGIALLAFGLTRRAWWPLTALAGGQVFFALHSVQWTPLFTAAVLLPALRLLWSIKPTSGAPLVVAYPDRRVLYGALVLYGLAFALHPAWTDGWLAAAGAAPHRPAVLRPGGFLLLLALLRWRLPEARQLAVLACVPLSPHLYEAVPLMLAARTRRELLALALCGTLGLAAGAFTPPHVGPDHGPIPWYVVFFAAYLPALLVVLRHRNVRPPSAEPFTPLATDGARDG
ncbi:MAG TPA: hypothetical protein VFM14_10810 [Gemmatimonadales bacterium]|nr:hypothetical protein [Gemmatimonadales bacterium]